MQATPTIPEPVIFNAQMRIRKDVWDRIKIQSIREGCSAAELAAKAFEEYLKSHNSEE